MCPQSLSPIGLRIRQARKGLNLSLAQLAKDTGVSEATLSRIETAKTEATAQHLYRLSAALNMDIADFFSASARPLNTGVRAITRNGEGVPYHSDHLSAHVLCTDLSHKKMHPFLNRITAHSVADAGGLTTHVGEEFIYVLTGYLNLYTQAYEPLHLAAGDAIYFDGSQPHAYVNADRSDCEIIVITTAEPPKQIKDNTNV